MSTASHFWPQIPVVPESDLIDRIAASKSAKRERQRLFSMAAWLEHYLADEEIAALGDFPKAIDQAVTALGHAIQGCDDDHPTWPGAMEFALAQVEHVDRLQTDANTQLTLIAIGRSRCRCQGGS